MTTRLWLLALGIAWSLNAIFLYMLAEAHWGSILNRFFATVLIGLAVLAFTFAFGTSIWRTLERLAMRFADRYLSDVLESAEGRLSLGRFAPRLRSLSRFSFGRFPFDRLPVSRASLAQRSHQIMAHFRSAVPRF